MGMAAIYLSVAPNRLTNANFGSDAGDFLAAALTGGIPHPSGYPTYTLLGLLFQFLPIGTPVFRGVLESLVPAAFGAGLLTGWVGFVSRTKSTAHYVAAVITGTAWGAAPLLFSQAIIIEVHGLQSLFVVLALWWITLNLDFEHGQNEKWLLVLSFLIGLGIGNHLTILLFVPAMVFFLYYLIRHSGQLKLALGQVCLVMAGMLVYIYLPLRAQAYPPINWGNPQTWSGFFWEVGANPYRGLLFGTQSTELWERISSISRLLLNQFGAVGLATGAIGLVVYSFPSKWPRWILAWLFIVYFAFAVGYNTEDSASYLVPAVMVFSIWIGLGVASLWNIRWHRYPVGSFLVALLAISIWLRIPGTRQNLDPRTQDQPARYAEQLLDQAPKNAIIYTTTDQDTFPLWYYHFGLGERPDLRVIVLSLTQFVWYQQGIIRTYPDLTFPAIYENDLPNADWGKQVTTLNPERPVCHTQLSQKSETGVAITCTSP